MTRITTLAFALLTLALGGCLSTRVGDLTLVANRNVPLTFASEGKVKAEACTWLNRMPSLEEALDRAQDKVANANALQDVAITFRLTSYVLIERKCFVVEGEAVRVEGE